MSEPITIGNSVLAPDEISASCEWVRGATDADLQKLQNMFNSISATGRNASNLIEQIKVRAKKRLANNVNNKV